jgi:hypothetical protein
MRSAIFAVAVCLVATASASAQPAAAAPGLAAPPAYPSNFAPVADPALAAKLDAVTGADPWCMNGPRAWASAEYLLWWVRPMATPDLIQTVPSALALNAVATNSSLPSGSAQRFFPDSNTVQFGAFSGVRGTAGINFDRFGLDATGFFLPQVTKSASLFNNGTPNSVAESFIRAGTGTPISLLASVPGQSTGGISSSVSSQLWGFDTNVRLPFYNFLTDYTDALVGFRYLDLQEKIATNFASSLNNGSSFLINESVQTRNQFYGGQIGLNGKINGLERGIGLDATGKLALGSMQQQATLLGTNTIVAPGALPSTQMGGLFASGANQGTFARGKIAMVYEQNVNATYNFNRWTQIYVGYSVIYVSSVIRPGNAIDPVVNDANLRFVANPPANAVNRPAFQWHASDFWAQGINFGLRLQY